MGKVAPILLDGDALAQSLRAEMAERVAGMRASGIVPGLATVLVGENPDSLTYVGRKHADCRELGIEARNVRLPASTPPAELSATIRQLNADSSVHGFLVQLPLPRQLDGQLALEEVDPGKDIDGLHPANLGRLVSGAPSVLPCTPAGILALIRHYNVPVARQRVVIIGRGAIVGRPLALLLSMRGIDATVTLVHTHSPDIGEFTRAADIVISAAGVPDLITGGMVRPGAAVIGVGIGRDKAGATASDIADDVAETAGWFTPRHGSVGALTRAMLLRNLLDFADGLP